MDKVSNWRMRSFQNLEKFTDETKQLILELDKVEQISPLNYWYWANKDFQYQDKLQENLHKGDTTFSSYWVINKIEGFLFLRVKTKSYQSLWVKIILYFESKVLDESLTKINDHKCNFYLFNPHSPHINVSVTKYVVLILFFHQHWYWGRGGKWIWANLCWKYDPGH